MIAYNYYKVILILVGKFDNSLFCNGQDVGQINSTTFCLINGKRIQLLLSLLLTRIFLVLGITLHWFFSSTPFFWLFLVLSILYKAGRHNPTQLELKRSKYVHMMLTVFGKCMNKSE